MAVIPKSLFLCVSMKFDTSVISRTVCFKFPVVYEGIKTYGPIISKLTRPHEKSTLVHSDALFQSVTLPNVRMFDDRARLRVLEPDSTRMLFGNECGKNGAVPPGVSVVNPIKLKPGHLHGRRCCFTTLEGNQTACRHWRSKQKEECHRRMKKHRDNESRLETEDR